MEMKFVGEHWRENLSGLQWDSRLQSALTEAHLRETRLAKAELDLERLLCGGEVDQCITEASMVAVVDSKGKVEDVGFNTPSDLFNDNFGKFLACCIAPVNHPKRGQPGINMKNLSNVDRAFVAAYATYYNSSRYDGYNASSGGTQFQFGSSNAAPTRVQYNVVAPLVNTPESGRFSTGPSSFSPSGVITFGGALVASGNGTINELCLFAHWEYTQGGWDDFLIARDVLASPIAYVATDKLIALGVVSC